MADMVTVPSQHLQLAATLREQADDIWWWQPIVSHS